MINKSFGAPWSTKILLPVQGCFHPICSQWHALMTELKLTKLRWSWENPWHSKWLALNHSSPASGGLELKVSIHFLGLYSPLWIVFHGLVILFATIVHCTTDIFLISYIWLSSRSWACAHTPIAPVPFSHAESAALCEITSQIQQCRKAQTMFMSQWQKPLDKFVMFSQVRISNETINEHDKVWECGIALETDGFQPKRWCCLAEFCKKLICFTHSEHDCNCNLSGGEYACNRTSFPNCQ